MKTPLRIDIVSDVMCPWCVIGYAGLNKALAALADKLDAEIHWQPFELNPDMGPEGQNLREHINEKYGSTDEESKANRERLSQMGAKLGFTFNFSDESRIVNTFNAHQLLHWVGETNQGAKQSELKMALFTAHFSEGRDVSNVDELVAIAESVGLSGVEARAVLDEQRFAGVVRANQQQWQEAGINSVPAVILNEQYLLSGGQPPENYIQAFTQIIQMHKQGE